MIPASRTTEVTPLSEENKAILIRALDNWNKGDLDRYLQIYDPNVVLHGYQGVGPGLDSVKQFYMGFWAAFPGVQITIDDVVAEGDQLACRFTAAGTNTGPFMGMPPTGKQVNFTGMTILRFANGKCVERWAQADFMGLMQQLGVIPAPGQG